MLCHQIITKYCPTTKPGKAAMIYHSKRNETVCLPVVQKRTDKAHLFSNLMLESGHTRRIWQDRWLGKGGADKNQHQTKISRKGNKATLYAQPLRTSIRSGMRFRSTQIPVHAALEKAFKPEMMKGILKARTQKVQELQHVANAQVRADYKVMRGVYIVLQEFVTATLTCCLLWSQKYNLAWGLQQLREVWTKDFKSSPAAEDDVQEDDVELAGEGSGEASRVDEDPFVFWKTAWCSQEKN